MIPEPLYTRIAPWVYRTIGVLRWDRSTLRAPIQVRHVRIPLGLGKRIVLCSDLHADERWFGTERVRGLVDLVNGVDDVDLVAMPGDFVGHDAASIEWTAAELGRIDAPVVATLGNHDHMTDPERVTDALERVGIDVLTDRAERIGGIWVAGVESRWVRAPEPGSIDAMLPNDEPCVVVGHEPALALAHGQALHLAGHTHHGQVRVRNRPVVGRPTHSGPFTEALSTVPTPAGDRYVYVTGGVGCTTVPIRINVPPEIVVLDV